MITITYDPTNTTEVYNDSLIKKICASRLGIYLICKNNIPVNFTFANELAIIIFRRYVKEGRINYNDILFKYRGVKIRCDNKGRFMGEIPNGFCTTWLNEVSILFDN